MYGEPIQVLAEDASLDTRIVLATVRFYKQDLINPLSE